MATAPGGSRVARTLSRALGDDHWRLKLWDGTQAQGSDAPRFTLTIHSRAGLSALLDVMPERAFGRAYASGELDIEPLGPFLELVARSSTPKTLLEWPRVLAALLAAGALPSRHRTSEAEAQLQGRRHSKQRDAAAVRHHYDLPPEFYAIWLDRTMTYSCAYFEQPEAELDQAQAAKLDLVCRKLRLRPGERLLDVGSGWGSLVLHAAQFYGVEAVGITLSPRQLEESRTRAAALRLGSRAAFRLADYRDSFEHPFDAVASVGMIEHVGRTHLRTYARSIRRALRPGGRALIHGITCPPATPLNRTSFINTFVFPDGELEDVSRVVRALELEHLEVRDVENLREHYALTLTHWVRRLEQRWEEAVRIAGPERARVWRLYMSASIVAFRTARIGVHQTLAVRTTADGRSGLPLTRDDWYPQVELAGERQKGLPRPARLPAVTTSC